MNGGSVVKGHKEGEWRGTRFTLCFFVFLWDKKWQKKKGLQKFVGRESTAKPHHPSGNLKTGIEKNRQSEKK